MKKLILFLLFTGIFSPAFAQIELSDDDAEAKLLTNDGKLIVLDFYATWCGPCKRMEPIIKELVNEYRNENVVFYKIDVDKSQVDDALNINAMPTYLFIKNSANLDQIEGAMSKSKMKSLIDKYLNSSSTTSTTVSNSSSNDDELVLDFSESNIQKNWNDSDRLNSLAWHAYKEKNDIDTLLKAIKIVDRSIELNQNYYNTDTRAALYYKTGKYNEALKEAKKAIDIAKSNGESYTSTTELIEKIIDKM